MSFELYGPVATLPFRTNVSVKLIGDMVAVYHDPYIKLYTLTFDYIGVLELPTEQSTPSCKLSYSVNVYKPGTTVPLSVISAVYHFAESIRQVLISKYALARSAGRVFTGHLPEPTAMYYYTRLGCIIFGNALGIGSWVPFTGSTLTVTYDPRRRFTYITPVAYSNDYTYIVAEETSGRLEVLKLSTGELYRLMTVGIGNVYSPSYVVYTDQNKVVNRNGMITAFPDKSIVLVEPGYYKAYRLDLESYRLVELPFIPGRRLFGTYCVARSQSLDQLQIYDYSSNTVVSTVTAPHDQVFMYESFTSLVDYPFVVTLDDHNMYIYLLKYQNVVPVIQFDAVRYQLRVVDYITGEPLTADLYAVRSIYGTPADALPPGAEITVIQSLGWFKSPACMAYETYQYSVKGVY